MFISCSLGLLPNAGKELTGGRAGDHPLAPLIWLGSVISRIPNSFAVWEVPVLSGLESGSFQLFPKLELSGEIAA
jgi:hypothetical protein